ncbi:hypothetical protein SAMN04487948_12247 [Halogranum amylolyticum]|uniref:Uncharacterized protein n=1 Tax=Halogranum amylolyticum TaxID=660520 RepID=A0A1H8W2Q3_9EURY|nr:hypothetical protein [Halogranum amylolyticum]SEP21803.1 hypothetical protein SAMN04487948_12247 [Halogranum amylolyticum]
MIKAVRDAERGEPTASDPAGLGEHVPDEIREQVGVEDDRGEDREEDVDDEQSGDDDTADDDVAQESAERPDVALFEDGVLLGEDDPWVTETAPDRRPLAGVQAGDEEVIEVDTDADDGGVADEEPPGVAGSDVREGDGGADDNRDEEVLVRVDERSPSDSRAATAIKPTAWSQSRSLLEPDRDERERERDRAEPLRRLDREEREDRPAFDRSPPTRSATPPRTPSSSPPVSPEKRRASRGIDNTRWNSPTRSGSGATR